MLGFIPEKRVFIDRNMHSSSNNKMTLKVKTLIRSIVNKKNTEIARKANQKLC